MLGVVSARLVAPKPFAVQTPWPLPLGVLTICDGEVGLASIAHAADEHLNDGGVPEPLVVVHEALVVLSVSEPVGRVAPPFTYPTVPQAAVGQYWANTGLLPELLFPCTSTFQPEPVPVASSIAKLFICVKDVWAEPFNVTDGSAGIAGADAKARGPGSTAKLVALLAVAASAWAGNEPRINASESAEVQARRAVLAWLLPLVMLALLSRDLAIAACPRDSRVCVTGIDDARRGLFTKI